MSIYQSIKGWLPKLTIAESIAADYAASANKKICPVCGEVRQVNGPDHPMLCTGEHESALMLVFGEEIYCTNGDIAMIPHMEFSEINLIEVISKEGDTVAEMKQAADGSFIIEIGDRSYKYTMPWAAIYQLWQMSLASRLIDQRVWID